MRKSVETINGRKPIGAYDAVSRTYSKWVKTSHRLWKAGGAFTIDAVYLDDIWPTCEWVEVYNQTNERTYRASVDLIRGKTWRDASGSLHRDRYGDQYALPGKYWREVSG
jgi:hypothetical protein